MKLSKEQKIRIARFLTLHPHVTQTAVAELFDVSCSTIAGIMKEHGFHNHEKWHRYVFSRYRAQIESSNSDQDPLYL